MKLTAPQIAGLRYYSRLESKTGERVKYPDQRVIGKLAELQLVAVVGFNYGPLYRLTEAGRSMLGKL